MYDSRSGLRYRYAHSKLKPRVDALREKLRSRIRPKAAPPPKGGAAAEDGKPEDNDKPPESSEKR